MLPNVRALVAEMDREAKLRSKPEESTLCSLWQALPMDIMRLILAQLRPADVQATLLVCKAWQSGVAGGILALKPRNLKVATLPQGEVVKPEALYGMANQCPYVPKDVTQAFTTMRKKGSLFEGWL